MDLKKKKNNLMFWSKISEYQGKTELSKSFCGSHKKFQESEWQWISQQHHLKQENEVIPLILQKTTNSGREFHTQPKLV